MQPKIPKYAIRNFFMVRRWYNYIHGGSYIVLGIIMIFFDVTSHPKILWIPLLVYLLALCLSVELSKIMFNYPSFKRKKSGKTGWMVSQIAINLFAAIALLGLMLFHKIIYE
ncbi:MAG: hypothetical protein LBN23_02950 [Paludibacter sp.]|jgi:hypothetical protein|nr:hypothetical protein [Paludibacter sp.]